MTSAAVAWARPCTCEPHHTSHASGRTRTVQESGSIAAWARKGWWYVASILRADRVVAAITSPSLRATTPGWWEASSSLLTTSAVAVLPLGPSSQRMPNAVRPCFAAHV